MRKSENDFVFSDEKSTKKPTRAVIIWLCVIVACLLCLVKLYIIDKPVNKHRPVQRPRPWYEMSTDPAEDGIYIGQTTFIAEESGWNPHRQGSVDVEYDIDHDGTVDFVDRVGYNGLTPGKQYTIQSQLVLKSDAEGIIYSTLVDEDGNVVAGVGK